MRTLLAAAIAFCLLGTLGCKPTNAVNKALGGPTVIEMEGPYRYDKSKSKDGRKRPPLKRRVFELNYDLKKTINNAKPAEWGCKCQLEGGITIGGKQYTIFADCERQNGCQLIRVGERYYLIDKKLTVNEKKVIGASD